MSIASRRVSDLVQYIHEQYPADDLLLRTEQERPNREDSYGCL